MRVCISQAQNTNLIDPPCRASNSNWLVLAPSLSMVQRMGLQKESRTTTPSQKSAYMTHTESVCKVPAAGAKFAAVPHST
eukprot:2533153-Amphidinium_carterae.2